MEVSGHVPGSVILDTLNPFRAYVFMHVYIHIYIYTYIYIYRERVYHRYIMMEAHVVDEKFRRAPLEMKSEFDFPHMTFVKLEHGEALRRDGELVWRSTITNQEINITGMLATLNHSNKSSGLAFKLVPVRIQRSWQWRYEITGCVGLSRHFATETMRCEQWPRG